MFLKDQSKDIQNWLIFTSDRDRWFSLSCLQPCISWKRNQLRSYLYCLEGLNQEILIFIRCLCGRNRWYYGDQKSHDFWVKIYKMMLHFIKKISNIVFCEKRYIFCKQKGKAQEIRAHCFNSINPYQIIKYRFEYSPFQIYAI